MAILPGGRLWPQREAQIAFSVSCVCVKSCGIKVNQCGIRFLVKIRKRLLFA